MHPPSGLPLATTGRRFGALLIDYTAVLLLCSLLFVVLVIVVSTVRPQADEAVYDIWGALIVFGWGLALFFYSWLTLMLGGRSLGKAMLGIKVVRAADGGPPTQTQAIVRSTVFGLPHSLPCVGHVFVLVECLAANGDAARRRALHDRAADTVVLRG